MAKKKQAPQIWCVEDDEGIRDVEVYALKSVGFGAKGFENSEAFFAALESDLPDLVILDIMLPGVDGVDVLKRLRSEARTANVPVIMATVKNEEFDKVTALDLGADDYLVKPFGMMEMISRVRAVLRRAGKSEKTGGGTLAVGKIILNDEKHLVTVAGEEARLTKKEYALLKILLQEPGRAFTREELFAAVWGYDYMGESRTLDAHIKTLRKKLGREKDRIETVRNVGYRLNPADKE